MYFGLSTERSLLGDKQEAHDHKRKRSVINKCRILIVTLLLP